MTSYWSTSVSDLGSVRFSSGANDGRKDRAVSCLIWFLFMGCFHIPDLASSNSCCRRGTMSLGSDLFYEPFKEDGSLLTIEECRKSEAGEYHKIQPRVCWQDLPLFFWSPWRGSSSLATCTWKAGGKMGPPKNIRHFPQNAEHHAHHQHHIKQLKLLMSTLPSCDFLPVVWEDVLTGSEMLVEVDLWANSVSFVHTFQWVWTDSYLCVLVTRAIFHPFDWTPVLCASKGPSWRKK